MPRAGWRDPEVRAIIRLALPSSGHAALNCATFFGLLVVSGVSSCATGLAPLDQDATLHAIAATPLFVAQPAALLLLGARVRAESPRLGTALLATGAVTAAAAVGFVLSGEGRAAGALERAALWPVLLGLGAYGWRHLRRQRPPGPADPQ